MTHIWMTGWPADISAFKKVTAEMKVGGGGKCNHPSAANEAQYNLVLAFWKKTKTAPVPGYLVLGKRLGDQGQALSV